MGKDLYLYFLDRSGKQYITKELGYYMTRSYEFRQLHNKEYNIQLLQEDAVKALQAKDWFLLSFISTVLYLWSEHDEYTSFVFKYD